MTAAHPESLASSPGRAVLLLIALTACRSEPPTPAWAHLDAELQTIRVSDGIDQQEAKRIADIYFSEYVRGRGIALTPTLRDGVWTADLLIDFAGIEAERVIQVDARTGAVWSTRGPRFADLDAFRSDVVGTYSQRREKVEPTLAETP